MKSEPALLVIHVLGKPDAQPARLANHDAHKGLLPDMTPYAFASSCPILLSATTGPP
jgi:hypothetical protein